MSRLANAISTVAGRPVSDALKSYVCHRCVMAETLNEGPAHCPKCGAEAYAKIVQTDEVDHEGEPRVDSVVDCPNCGHFVIEDIANQNQ